MRKLIVILLLSSFGSFSAEAGMCKANAIKSRHTTEAASLASENFATATATGTGDYVGSATYNAHVIACNRKRDTHGGKIEKDVSATQVFPANLAVRFVKGHYNYFGNLITQQRYMYRVERSGGNWIVTVPAEFHFPGLKLTKFLDLTMPLADRLGIATSVCATTEKKGGKVTRGLVPKATNSGKWAEDTCRVGRDESFTAGGVTKDVKDWYMEYWRDVIQAHWTRAGFELRFKIINLDEVTATELAAFKKHGMIWHVRLNMNPTVTPRYKSNPLFLHPIYSGIDPAGFVHEFGHVLGLDDEYPKSECDALGGNDYIMCDAFTLASYNQKAVYPWIVTRRHAIGKAP